MKKLSVTLIYFVTVWITTSCLFSDDLKKIDPFPNIKIPIYGNAYGLKEYINDQVHKKEVFYKINIKYPAEGVISFYENKFHEMRLLSYLEDGYGKKRWENFDPKTGNWEGTNGVPARYIETWIDKEKKIRIVLFVRYEYDAEDKNWENRLLVNCSIQDYFEFNDKNLESETDKSR